MPTISVPGQGDVDFPDSMSEADITSALKKLSPPPAPPPGPSPHQKMVQAVGQLIPSVPGTSDAEHLDSVGHALGLSMGLTMPEIPGVRQAAGWIGNKISGPLRDLANKAGRRVLYGGANALSEKFPVTDASVEAAAKAGAFKPLGTTEHAANVLSDALDEAGAIKGQVVKEMEAAGIKGPDSGAVAQVLRGKAAWLRQNSAGTRLPELYEKVAADIEQAGSGGRLGVQQAENIKGSLQDAARYGDPNEKMLNIARRKIASTMRQGVEDASAADAATLGTPEAVAADAALIPAKQQYALLAPAAKAAEKGLSQATKRNAFSLRDTIMAAPMAAAHGAGAGAGAALLTKAMRAYGPSTASWALRGMANGINNSSSVLPESLRLAAMLEAIRQNRTPALPAEYQ